MGVIGGADGPTVIFLTSSASGWQIAGSVLAIAAAAVLISRWKRKK